MLKNVTLGQYFPGDSIVHRLDPRTKLVLLVVYIVALFVAKGVIAYGVMLLVLGTVIALSRIKLKAVLSGMKPILFIILFTTVLNMFFTSGEPIVEKFLGFITITKEGLRNAVFMVLRIGMLVTGTFMLTYTTSPIALTDGIESLLSPLKKIKVPVHEFAMMMSIALRFIPTLIEETDKIMSAQKARGASFDTGGLLAKAKAMLPLLVPLFVSAFRRAEELAVAMESRCYHGDKGRTRMKQLKMHGRDYSALLLGAIILAAIIVMKTLEIGYFGLY